MAFKKSAGEFRSSDGRHRIRYYVYEPADGPVRAVLQISHGMCEYIGRYEEFAEELCAHGILVCGNDHLGHGPEAREQGTLGYFAQRDGWKLLPADLRKLTVLMKRRYPGVPYFLLGHSMGSFIARVYLAKYGELLDGAVIMGTSGGNPFAGIGIRVAEGEIRRHGEMYRSPRLKKLSMGGYNKRFKGENDENSWLTKEKSIRETYAANDLCNFTFTASGYRDLFSLLRAVSEKGWAERVPKGLPILVTSGAEDPVGDYGKGVRKVYERLRSAGVKDVTLRLYEGDRHEILNETDRRDVYRDILGFLESHFN